jgi:peptidoglycan/LPS O-acetylase OafA/YrhL
MFGFFRFALSLLVVGYHLAGIHLVGWYSVYAFYTLSGFLMTLVITKKYALNPAGIADFVTNRFLRIYPPYLIVLASTWLLLQFPAFTQRANALSQGDLDIPTDTINWLENLCIWGWHLRSVKLVPQAWTIFRELFFCVLIFFPFARYRWLTLGWFAVGLAYGLANILRGIPLIEVYNSFANAAISYGAGCCLFHFQKNLRVLTRPKIPILSALIVAPLIFEFARPTLFTANSVVPLYLNALFSSYLVLVLANLRGSARWIDWDRRFGNLSYPIYLCHYFVPITLATVLGWSGEESSQLLWVSLPPIFAVAWLINRYVEQTIGYGYDQRRQTWALRWAKNKQSGAADSAVASGQPAPEPS